ncbi:DUF2637 domain-containing protein [Pseudonocardia sp. RS010]|uniref:DUF2637 domain-containing protein n=1 Tax=Pseudonocardia sp. RS010 TaxID=3385979 RepID=UPI0039A1832E
MTEPRDRDWVTWAGLGIVGTAAAIMSFVALSDLARILGATAVIPLAPAGEPDRPGPGVPVAWLLPLTVDVFAFVATRVWLRGVANAEAVTFARRAAWAAIVTTVVGNGLHGYLVSRANPDDPWIASVVAAAVPAVVFGGLVHLAHLVGRGPDHQPDTSARPDPWLTMLDDVLAEPWAAALHGWPPKPGEPYRDRRANNAQIAADVRRVEAELGRELKRDDIARLWGIGSSRATAVLTLNTPTHQPVDDPAAAPAA